MSKENRAMNLKFRKITGLKPAPRAYDSTYVSPWYKDLPAALKDSLKGRTEYDTVIMVGLDTGGERPEHIGKFYCETMDLANWEDAKFNLNKHAGTKTGDALYRELKIQVKNAQKLYALGRLK